MKNKYKIKNLDCANCALALETQIKKIDGVYNAAINFSASTFILEADDARYEEIFKNVLRIVHDFEPDVIIEEPNAKAVRKISVREIVSYCTLVLGIAIGAVVLFVKDLPLAAYWPLLISAVLLLGWQTYYKALMLLIRGVVNENLLVTISVAGAIGVGEHMESMMVILLYSVGKLLEAKAVERSKRSISALMELQPEYANLMHDEHVHKVSPEEVEVGSTILVKMGERVPLDGVCISDGGFVDMRHITGESAPVKIEKGAEVVSGSIVLDGVFNIKTTKEYKDSTVSQIMSLLESAAEKKSKTETVISKFARFYTLIVVACAVITFGITWAVLKNVDTAIYRGLIFLVVSCPCAFAISVPLSYFSGIGNASKKGILIKGSNYLDVCAKLDTVVFDKTGTLTSGHFAVEKIEPINTDKTEEEILLLAASGEQFSIHPIARAILHATKGKKLFKVTNFKEVAGTGISYSVGKNKYSLSSDPTTNGASVALLENNKQIARIVLVDKIKDTSFIAVPALLKKKLRCVILSGDNTGVTTEVAGALGINEFYANLEPKDKFAWLENLKKTHSKTKVAFVGDGINDAPSLRLADVGISMGLEGSPATVEASDVVLVDDNPEKLVQLVELSRNTRKIVIENIVFACVVKVAFLALSAAGVTGMLFAVFADVGVTLLAILNSLRTLIYKLPKTKKKKQKAAE